MHTLSTTKASASRSSCRSSRTRRAHLCKAHDFHSPVDAAATAAATKDRLPSAAAAALTATITGAALGWSCLAGPLPAHAGTTPYEDARRMVVGPTADGSVRACLTAVNPNCVSTASTNDAYAPVWRAPETSTAAAAEVLEQAVKAAVPGATLTKSQHLSTGSEYRAWTVDGLYGKDVMEFVIKQDHVSRSWEGDAPGLLVTFRSMAGGVKYVWPIQTPLTDFGAQKKRLNAVRSELGWQLIGCELLECYEDY